MTSDAKPPLLTYQYCFGSLYYEPDSNGAKAQVRLIATGQHNQEPLDREIHFFSSILQDEPERQVLRENRVLIEHLGKCRTRTAWVRYFDDGLVDFQVAIIPYEGGQRFYIRNTMQLSDDQRLGIENQIKNAFRP